MFKGKILLFLAFNSIILSFLQGEDSKNEIKPPKIGNFSLPSSQQPGSLYGFGQGVIDKGEVQLFFYADDFVGRHKTNVDYFPSVVFGVTEELSLGFYFPFTTYFKYNQFQSDGLEDCYIEAEYSIYYKTTYDYEEGTSVVAELFFPTGSNLKNPSTGFGAPAFFLGPSYYRTWIDWFVFNGVAAMIIGSDHGSKFGDQFVYQLGFGRNFPSPTGWIYAWLVEVDGLYSKKNRTMGVIDDNSGGNTIYVTPSLFLSTWDMVFQFGISFPVNQHLFGNQRKIDYGLNFNFSKSFY